MEHEIREIKTQVVVVGGGITGLSAALFLKQQGIDFILIERHRGTSIYPRARTIDVRTMELFRELGLSETLREGGKDLAPAWGIIKGDTMIAAMENPQEKITPDQLIAAQQEMQALSKESPESVCRCTQDISEAIIYDIARNQGSDLRFYHEMASFEQHDAHIEMKVRDRGSDVQYLIKADYMIAADGANSIVRSQLNIPTYGNIEGTSLLNIYFQADLEAVIKGKEFSQFLVDKPTSTGFLLSINNKDRWAFHLRYYPDKGETASDYTEDRLIAILHEILGIAQVKISIIKVLPWQLTVRIAEYLRERRVFLAGDAAHTMTPYAGKGANTGVQDVQNLAWKLAAVLKRTAGEALLDTYNTERQPIGAYYATLSGELAQKNGLINNALMVTKGKDLLGLPNYGYNSTAIARASDVPFVYFKGQAGTRLPHIWLDEAHTVSSIDWIKGEFTLIANEKQRWQAEHQHAEALLHMNIRLVGIDDQKILKQWKETTNTSDEEALLIRPDDFVAARVISGNLMNILATIISIVAL